jgi:glucuronosyltransferase
MKTVHLIGALLCLTLTLIVCSTPVSSSKILVLVFFSSKSHKITYMRLIEELASRGHEITVVTPIKQDKPIKNIKEVFTLDIQPFMSQINFFESKEKGQQLNPLVMLEMMSKVCSSSYDLPHVRALLDETFDLIFLQPFFNECVLGMAHKLKAPTVLFTPAGIPNGIVSAVGGHFPPSFVPHLMLGYGDEMTFYQRFINLGVNALMELLKNFLLIPKAQSIYREKLGDSSIPSVMEILGNTSLVLSNRHFSIHGPQPYLPDIIDVGGIHSRPAKPLPKVLFGLIQVAINIRPLHN